MPTTMERPAYLSPRQVAEALSVGRRTVYRWMEKEDLDSVKIEGSRRIGEDHLAEKVGKEVARKVFEAHAPE